MSIEDREETLPEGFVRIALKEDNKDQLLVFCDFLNPSKFIPQKLKDLKSFDPEVQSKNCAEKLNWNFTFRNSRYLRSLGIKHLVTLPLNTELHIIRTLKSLGSELLFTSPDAKDDEPHSSKSLSIALSKYRNFHLIENSEEEFKAQVDDRLAFIMKALKGKVDEIFFAKDDDEPGLIKVSSVKTENGVITQSENSHVISESSAFSEMRRIISDNAFFPGPLSSAATSAAIESLQIEKSDGEKERTFVVIWFDSSYEHPFSFSNEWLIAKNYWPESSFVDNIKGKFYSKTVKEFPDFFKPVAFFDLRMTISDCLELFRRGNNAIPIRGGQGILGVVTRRSLNSTMMNREVSLLTPCDCAMTSEFLVCETSVLLHIVYGLLEQGHVLILTEEVEGKVNCYVPSLENFTQILEDDLNESR